jgi:dienelactone hydrolase
MKQTSQHAALERAVTISAHGVRLLADLSVPVEAAGLVIVAHGSGSSRLSPRNRRVAEALNDEGFATLLLDLLTPQEATIDAATAQLRFDLSLLSPRLVDATRWALEQPGTRDLPTGYFGASTGAAAALIAAALIPDHISAIVSRGGRPDIAGRYLEQVRAPTLLIVGALDTPVIAMNREAFRRLRAPKELVIVERAGHLFEEPGALEQVSQLTLRWFEQHLAGRPDSIVSDGIEEVC